MKRREAIRTSAFLAGCGLSAGTIASIVSGCSPEPKEFADTYLGHDMVNILAEVVETIIPTTDTPGAKEAGVHLTIDSYVQGNFTEDEQNMFKSVIEGIKKAGFGKLNAEEREDFLLSMDDLEGGINPYDVLKGMTCQAYFSSELGAKNALAFDPIPGEYRGCIDLSEVGGKAWAIRR